jgi:signal peptidase I
VKRVLTGLFVVIVVLRAFAGEVLRIHSTSMLPTIAPNSIVLMDTFSFRRRNPHIGEIVSLVHPRTGELLLKRIAGLGGSTIAVENGHLIRDGKTIVERYTNQHNMEGFYFGPVVVPKGMVFVLGDNRAESEDSRSFGPIEIDQVQGRLLTKLR